MAFDPTPDQMRDALSDIYYEIQQFINACEFSSDTRISNMLVEVRLIHLRNLVTFFGTDQKDRYKDDVLSADFNFVRRIGILDSAFTDRLNKDLAHITYDRQKRRSEIAKRWPVQSTILPMLKILIAFILHLQKPAPFSPAPEQIPGWQVLLNQIKRLQDQLDPYTPRVLLKRVSESTSSARGNLSSAAAQPAFIHSVFWFPITQLFLGDNS
jgi:hypothetical protein